jgi:hypothetical protein
VNGDPRDKGVPQKLCANGDLRDKEGLTLKAQDNGTHFARFCITHYKIE